MFLNELHNLMLGQVVVLPMTLSHGVVWEDARTVIVSDTEIWGIGYKKTKARKTAGEKIDAFTDLKVGDYVVHEDYGIGIYQGTTRM